MRTTVGDKFAYRAFGLNIRSEVELPELIFDEHAAEPDVTIGLGTIPASADPRSEFSADEQGAFLSVPGVARYWISAGSRILVESEAGVPMRNVRLFLLGSAMGALLHQRGILPLHANAVEFGGKAYAFMGRSGAGKSTLAAAFHDRGYRVISDDVCVVQFMEDGRPIVFPGIPRLRLSEDAMEATGRTSTDFQLSYAGDENFRKFDVPVGNARGNRPASLAVIFLLGEAEAISVTRLHGLDAIEAIYANTYRGAYAASAGTSRDHWKSSVSLVRTTPVLQFCRPMGFNVIDDQLDYLLEVFMRPEAET